MYSELTMFTFFHRDVIVLHFLGSSSVSLRQEMQGTVWLALIEVRNSRYCSGKCSSMYCSLMTSCGLSTSNVFSAIGGSYCSSLSRYSISPVAVAVSKSDTN